MPMPDGTSWDYTPGDMVSLASLGYQYDDVSPAVPVTLPGDRLLRLGASAAAARAVKGASAVASGKRVELVGASREPVRIKNGEAGTSVQLDAGMRRKVSASLDAAPATAAPDRVFLNLENVRGLADSTAFHVYVGLPQGATPADHPERLAGSIALFGVRKASRVDGEHAGQGLTFVLDITNIVDSLHLADALDVDALDVRIVPLKPVPEAAQITIGRVSIFRQGR